MRDSYWVSPREANLLITARCNLRCRHCSVTSHGTLRGDLPLTVWTEILDELQRSKLLKLTITGGEPFVRKDFPDFLREVNRRLFRYSVNTNGTLVTPEGLERILPHTSRLNEFMVSLDGPDRETVDSQRGHGVYQRLVEGVALLREAGLPFGFYCTITSLNVTRLPETVEFAENAGAQWIKFNNFVLAGPCLSKAMVPSDADLKRAGDQLHELRESGKSFIQGTILDLRERVEKLEAGELPDTAGRAFSCGGGTGKVAIFPDGTVTPCDHIPEFRLGNITENSLQEILTGEKMREFTEILNSPRSTNAQCSTCEYLRFCTGGCPVEAIGKGELSGKDRLSCLKLAMENR